MLTDGTLHLRPFAQKDINDFRSLHADPDVMHDLGGPIDEHEALEKLRNYIAAFQTCGYGRMAAFKDGRFAGYVGVQQLAGPEHPLGPHDEIGWRLLPRFWGQGIAMQAAKLCLEDAFTRAALPHVFAYTTYENQRSQAVMTRLGMTREPELDFEEQYPPIGCWKGLVWRITASDWGHSHR